MRRYRMADLDIKEISYVGNPANRKKYVFIKGNGGDYEMDPIKLTDLSAGDRKILEIEVEKSITPGLKKDIEENIKKDYEKKAEQDKEEFKKFFTKEREDEIAGKLKVDIEQKLREQFGKQAEGVSADAAAKITAGLRDVTRGVTALGELVGFGYKTGSYEVELEDLKKEFASLKDLMITKADLADLIAELKV